MNSQLDQLTSIHGSTRSPLSGFGFPRLLRRVLGISSLLLLLGAAPIAAAYNIAFTSFDTASPWLNADGSVSGAVDSDNVPVGGIAVYGVEINNTATTDGVGLAAVFDLPGSTSIHEMPTYCAYAAGSTSRIHCTLPPITGGSTLIIPLKVSTAGMPIGAAVIYGAVGVAGNFPPLTTAVKDLSTTPSAPDPFFDGDLTLNNNKLSATVTLGNSADLALTKSADAATVIGGGIVTYTLKVDNHGPASSTNFKVIDNLPVGFEYVANSFASTTPGWSWDAATHTATYAGTLPNGPGTPRAEFTFKAKANVQSGNVTNSARVESVGTPDTNPSNNNDTVDTHVGPGADVAIAPTWNPSPVASEGALDLILKVDNHGPVGAEDVVVKGQLPLGTTFDSFQTPAGWSCTPPDVDNKFTCTRSGVMPVGGAGETITVKTHAPAASGNYSAPVSVTTTTDDPDLSNNDRVATVSVLAAGADLELGKIKKAADTGLGNLAEVIVPIGGRMVSTITVRNAGPAAVTGNAVVTDTLAIGEEYDPAGTSGDFTCSATPYSPTVAQVVTCQLLPARYPIALGAVRNLEITTIARAPGAGANGALVNNACANLDPITDSGVNKDNLPGNNCKSAGTGIGVSLTSANLKVSKTTRAPGNGDRLVTVADTEMSYEIVVTNTGAATAGVVVNDPIPGWSNGRTKADITTSPSRWDQTKCSMQGASVVCRFGEEVLGNMETITVTVKLSHTTAGKPGFLVDSVGNTPACPGTTPTATHWHCNTAGAGIDGMVAGAVAEADWSDNYGRDWVSVEQYADIETTRKRITTATTGTVGVNSEYNIQYRNNGPSKVEGISVTDTFTLVGTEPGFVLVSAALANGPSCLGNVVAQSGLNSVPSAGGQSYSNPTSGDLTVTITCPAIDLDAGQVQDLAVVIRPNYGGLPSGLPRSISNIAGFGIVGGNSGTDYVHNSDLSNDTKDAVLPLDTGVADLSVTKLDVFDGYKGDPIAFDGDNLANNLITYKISITNGGGSVATQVRISDAFKPADKKTVTFIGASATFAGTYDGALCTVGSSGATVTGNAAGTNTIDVDCNVPGAGFAGSNQLGVIKNGTSSYIYMRYRYDTNPDASGDTVSNMVSVQGAETDPQPGNNSLAEPQTTTILMAADVGISKTMVKTLPDSNPAVALQDVISVVGLKESFWYVLTGTNNGSGQSLSLDRNKAADGSGTRIVDDLPEDVTVTGPITWQKIGPAVTGMTTTPNGSGVCTQVSLKITCDVGDLTYETGTKGQVRILVPARWDSLPKGTNGPIAPSKNRATISTEQIDRNPGNDTIEVPLDVTAVMLSGYVFVDDAGAGGSSDGVRQSSETGIGSVQVTLTGNNHLGQLVSRTTQTDGTGAYKFDNLPASDAAGYTVTQKKVAGYSNGLVAPPISGNDAATFNPDTYLAATDSLYVAKLGLGVTVAGGTIGSKGAIAVNYNFPKVRSVSLSGYVYADLIRDDIKGTGDEGITNAVVELLDAAGAVITFTQTISDGFYQFTELHPGLTYGLREPRPAGHEDLPSAINPGLINGVACATCVTSTVANGSGVIEQSQIAGIQLKNGNGTLFNFGEGRATALSGIVYLDRNLPTSAGAQNGNGIFDGDDRGLFGVKLELYHKGIKVAEATTDSAGNYDFRDYNLTPDTTDKVLVGEVYEIRQPLQPAGLANGLEAGSNTITTQAVPVAGLTKLNFGEIAAYVSGRVYLDAANNDIYDASDTNLDNVSLVLNDGTAHDVFGDLVQPQLTASGTYMFRDLPAGVYSVTQPQQPQHLGVTTLNNATNAGVDGNGVALGTATGKKNLPSKISSITLPAGGRSRENNFGEILPVSVSGVVYLDVNDDGAMAGVAETGLDGVTIRLTGVNDLGDNVTVTDVVPVSTVNGGTFAFAGLRPGTYVLTEPNQPAGTANGKTTAGVLQGAGTTLGTASQVTELPSKIAAIALPLPGAASINNLFGELPRNSGITGVVWLDTDDSGIKEAGENGLAGVRLVLEGVDNSGQAISVAPTTTTSDGSYAFLDLPPGTYKVIEPDQPAKTLNGTTVEGSKGGTASGVRDLPSSIKDIVLGVSEISTENNFGEIPAGSIAGYVYNDSNDDGIKQNDEGGFVAISVVLSGTNDLGESINVSGKTDANGHYVFENLRPGTYVVTEPTQPAETLNGWTTAGTIDGLKSTARVTGKETVPSVIDGIVLKPGSLSVNNNFGEIGDSPDMLVSKSSSTVKFTVNNVATYTIRVRNGGQKPSFGEYIVKDRLPVGLSLAEVPVGNGWICSGVVGDGRFECRSSDVVNAGATSLSDITVKANVSAEAAKAGTVNNAVLIEGGGENEFRTPTTTERSTFEGDVSTLPVCDTAITQNVCRVPNQVQLSSSVGGTVWFDVGSEDTFLDGGDERLQSWIVELMDSVTGLVSQSTSTAVDGSYRFADVIPGVKWNIQFRDPTSGVLWAWPVNQETAGGMGVACDSPRALGNDGVSACRVSENGTSQLQVVLEAGQHLPQQSLPVDPSGVVYDAVTRDPVPGSIVTIAPVGVCTGYDPKTAILNAGAGGYRVEGNAVSMTVGNNGYYQFMFGPAAPARCEFQLTVTPPGGYQFVSSLIPAETGSLSPLGAAGSSHLVQPQTGAPTGAVGTPTQYWLTLFAGSATAGVVHNHIPLDTAQATGLVITKTGDRQTAEIGDTVQYTITVRQTAGSAMATLNVVDTLPRGFTYIDGTGRVGGRAVEDPFGKPGPRLGFNLGPINVGQQLVLTYRVRVGVGAQQGDGINRAQAHGCSISGGCIDPGTMTPVPGSIPSNRAEYRVRVTGGVFTEEACVLGKIFVDCNNNHVQDEEELGIPGVRMYFSNGTWMISDSEGKYSYCGLPPQSHTLKVDPSTLPVGARLTTSSNRNLGDADSLFLDLKNGELHRADFVEGSCANPLLEQVKARRTQGEVRAPETETGQSQLRFDSKPVRAPQQATDSSNQRPIVQPRPNPPSAAAQQEVQP